MRSTTLASCVVSMLVLTALPAGLTAQRADPATGMAVAVTAPDRIWRDPGDVASLDLMYGAGGRANAPGPASTFTFVSEDAAASSPKFEVVDDRGVAWKVKLAPESQPETAATRFLWAAGYFVDEDYYVAELRVAGLPVLRRGQAFVSAGGIVHGVRLELKRTADTKLGEWDWFHNPFVGQRELNGLRVMMSLVNNWDLKQVNNAIYAVDGERHYAVSDAGATFGKTGSKGLRTKGIPTDYEGSSFIAKDRPDVMDFVMESRPFFLSVISVLNYRERTRMEQITKHIPRGDAKWLGQRLSKLTDNQIRDGFRAAGYGVADVDILTNTIRQRIMALEAL
jgi:hypothetical protein